METRVAMLAFFLVAFIAAAGPATGTLQDGRPRPPGYPDLPTTSYGPTPPCYNGSVAVTCNWYGFSHILYPTLGAICNARTRRVLSNTTLVGPGDLEPYTYYYLHYYVFDTTTNTSYCLYGCFNLNSIAAAPPPGFNLAPPPVADTPPPTVTYPPPPALVSPPLSPPPPPATLFTPPPPLLVTPSPPASDGAATPPPATSTPPVPNTRVINLNGAPGFLRPTGLVSFVLSGALLILHGLAGF